MKLGKSFANYHWICGFQKKKKKIQKINWVPVSQYFLPKDIFFFWWKIETNILWGFEFMSIYKCTPVLSWELSLLFPEFKSLKLYLKCVFSSLHGEKSVFQESYQIKLVLCRLLVDSPISPGGTTHSSLFLRYSGTYTELSLTTFASLMCALSVNSLVMFLLAQLISECEFQAYLNFKQCDIFYNTFGYYLLAGFW